MTGGKILILDAKRRSCLSRARVLSEAGHDVASVATIEQAVAATGRERYELLVVDVREPELLNMLLAQVPSPMSTLITASRSDIGRAAECAGTGMLSFLTRPFSPTALKQTVAQALDRSRQIRESIRSDALTPLELAKPPATPDTETGVFLTRIAEISAGETTADYVLLSIKDRRPGKPTVRAEAGHCRPGWRELCDQAALSGEAILVDKSRDPPGRLSDRMTEVGVSSLMSVPLVIGGTTSGSLGLCRTAEKSTFSGGELHFVSVMANWSSMTLDNSRLLGDIRQEYLRTEKLLEEITVAQENERSRIAFEIHDGVAQWMVGASYRIRTCSRLVAESKLDELDKELTETRSTVQKSIRELRRTIANLRPAPLEEMGLVEAIRRTAATLEEDGINCTTQVDAALPKLSVAEENTTYWIVQEILTNIRKHARADTVRLRIGSHDHSFQIEISDNGLGFSPEHIINNETPLTHIGLLGMKERAELLGGFLKVDSGEGRGTSVDFAFPVSSLRMAGNNVLREAGL